MTWTAYKQWNQGVENYEVQVFDKSLNQFTTVEKIHEFSQQNNYSFIDKKTNLNSEYYCYRIIAYRNGDNLESVSNEVCIPTEFNLSFPQKNT